MKFEEATNIIDAELKKFSQSCCGYKAMKKTSVSTCSVYYTISNGQDCLAFRVSDHNTSKNSINTLNLSYGKDTTETVKRFVRNKIAGLSKRSFNRALGLSTKKNWEFKAEITWLMDGAVAL